MGELGAGTRFAHYEILRRLGAGGMGEVYEAIDMTLERPVAVKILPADLAVSNDALKRFTREAKTASSLNHPGIVTIYETGSAMPEGASAAVNYIAMELVRGETLRSFLARGDRGAVLPYLEQCADAVAKAHAAGIVHRDLKPENIMITADGFAKVLDFGLAKIAQPLGESSATQIRNEEITRAGVVVGTLGYMSPEQLQGREADQRSDIFSFGCILYEAATGRQPFRGMSAAETFHKIVYDPPPAIVDVDPPVPPDLMRTIRKALAKDPDDRYQSIKEIAIDLRDIRNASGSFVRSGTVALPERRRSQKKLAIAATAAVVTVAAIAAWLVASRPGDKHATFEAMSIDRLAGTSEAAEATLSKDGRYVAFVSNRGGKSSIIVRQMATGSEITVAPPENTPYSEIQFSNDREYLRFVHRGSLHQIPVLGGQAKLLAAVDGPFSFSPDEKRIAFVRDGSLFVADASGGGERQLAAGDDREYYVRPAWSPRGDVIACSRRSLISAPPSMSIEIIRVDDSGPAATLAAGKDWFVFTDLDWLTDGSAVLVTGGKAFLGEKQIWRIRYPGGESRRITNDLFDYSGVSVADDRSQLVSLQTDARSSIWMARLSASEELQRVVDGVGAIYGTSALSDGDFIFAARSGDNVDIWKSSADAELVRLTDHPAVDSNPIVSPVRDLIAFTSTRTGNLAIWTMAADGTRQRQITAGKWDTIPNFAPDGKWITYVSRGTGQPIHWKVPVDGGDPLPLSDLERQQREGMLAPDGRYILHSERGSGLTVSSPDGKVVRRFEAKGHSAAWSGDGESILYINGGALHQQPLRGAAPRKIVDFYPDELSSFTVLADGDSFICVRNVYHRGVVSLKNFD